MATIRRKKLEHKAENGSGRFGLLELSSSDEDLLARNTPLAEAIATAFVDALYEGLISEPLSLSGAKLAKSKAEYRGYFANIFSGGELLRDAGNAEFVSGLSTRTYLRGLPFADELFTTHVNEHSSLSPDSALELTTAFSKKLWWEAQTASDNFADHQPS